MAFDPVLIGATANDGTGDPLRTAFTRVNSNFNVAVEGPATTPVTDNTTVVFDSTSGRLVKQAGAAVAAGAGKFAPTGNITAGNGMYLPAGNTVAFSTNGVERLRIDSSGNVGIGETASVNHKLIVRAGTSATGNSALFRTLDGTYNTSLEIQHSTAGIKLMNANSFGAAANNLIFGNSTTAETMRIAGNGNVIFGNGDTGASPAAATLRGTNASGTNIAGPNMTIQAGRGTGTGAGGSLSLQTAAAGTTGSSLNAATTRLFINAAGNVGIGTTSPSSQTALNVNGTFQVGTASTSNLPSNFSVFTQRTKTSIAPAGTAVLDIQADTSIAIVAQVVIDVYLATNAGLQGHFKYDYLTITPNGTVGGTATITTMYDGSTGSFVVAGGDFVVTRPSAGLIRITYTNGNGAGNNNIGFLVSGYGIATATVT
jgi:hypothetical protein